MRSLTADVIQQAATLSWTDLPASAALFAEGKLMLSSCPDCGNIQVYPTTHCVKCSATPRPVAAGGSGTVYSWTVIRKTKRAGFRDVVPYVVALVDLAEGPRVMGNVVIDDPSKMRIGMSVEMLIANLEAGRPVVQWVAP